MYGSHLQNHQQTEMICDIHSSSTKIQALLSFLFPTCSIDKLSNISAQTSVLTEHFVPFLPFSSRKYSRGFPQDEGWTGLLWCVDRNRTQRAVSSAVVLAVAPILQALGERLQAGIIPSRLPALVRRVSIFITTRRRKSAAACSGISKSNCRDYFPPDFPLANSLELKQWPGEHPRSQTNHMGLFAKLG